MAHNWTWGAEGSNSDPLNLSILASNVRMLPVSGSKNGPSVKTSVKSPLGERVTLCPGQCPQERSALEISPALPTCMRSSVSTTHC